MGARRSGRATLIAWFLLGAVLVPLAAPAGASEVELLPVRSIGGPGHAELYGWGLATALDGSVYVGDYWNYRIQHYATDGSLLGTIVPKRLEGAAPHQPPYGIAVDPRNGDIYFGDVDSDATVDKYAADGTFLFEFGGRGTDPTPAGTGFGQFAYPSRVAVASDGLVVVSDSRAEKLAVYDDSGNVLFEMEGQLFGDPVLGRPRGVAFDDSDRLYVADALLQTVQVFEFTAGRDALTYVTSYGIKKDHPGEPNPGELGLDLRGIAIDNAGDWLYVVDADTGYVAKFSTTDGQFLTFFGGEGTADGKFNGGGRDITVDGDGNVWVGDMPNFRAQKFSPWGQFLMKIPTTNSPPPPGGFAEPRSAAVDAAGNVFVTDTHNWRIQKFDAAGNFVTQWGSRGPDAEEFNYAKGIAVDWATGDVIVSDTDGNAIKRFDNDGNPRCLIDKHGSEPGQFKGALSVDVGSDGLIYVADTQNGRIQVLETNPAPGDCKIEVRPANGVLGSPGTGLGQFQATNGVAVDTDLTVWVTDRLLGRVTHLANDGTYLGSFGDGVGTGPTEFERASDIEVDDQFVYVSDADANRIKIWRKDGTFVREWGAGGGSLGQLQRPHGMDLTPDGRLYITEQTNERVQEVVLAYDVDPESNQPTVAVEAPNGGASLPVGPMTFSGTATDDTGLTTVQIAIKSIDRNLWWTGSQWGPYTWLVTTTSANGLGVTSVTWTYPFEPDEGAFGFQTRSQDIWGNTSTSSSWRSFSAFDGPPDAIDPETVVDVPGVNESFPFADITLSGIATDNSAVESVTVAIKNSSTGQWWTGSDWGGFTRVATTLASPGSAATNWTYTFAPPQEGTYGVQVQAADHAGNVDPTPVWRNFTVADAPADAVSPETEVTTPSPNGTYPLAPIAMSGAATDNLSVAKVTLAIRRNDTNQWWDGATWGGFSRVTATLDATGCVRNRLVVQLHSPGRHRLRRPGASGRCRRQCG